MSDFQAHPPPERRDGPPCPSCGAPTILSPGKGTHAGRMDCPKCGAWRWTKAKWTRSRAHAFRLPYGEYQGRSVGELVAEGAEGRRYAGYVAREWHGNAAIACAIALGLRQADPSGP
jgi:ribosomal protein S27AE